MLIPHSAITAIVTYFTNFITLKMIFLYPLPKSYRHRKQKFRPARVVQLMASVQQFDGRRVAVNVDHRPQLATCLHTVEEDALLLSVDAEVDVAGMRNVVEQHGVSFTEPLGQCLGPVSCFVGQVRTCVLRQGMPQGAGIVACKTEPYYSTPVIGHFQELYIHL